MAAVLKTVIGASLSRVQIPAPPPLVAGLVGIVAPVAAAVIVTVAGLITPDYDPITRTVSRLAEPGKPAVLEIEMAIYLVALALLLLGLSGRPRPLLAIAGVAMLVVASVHLDPASAFSTALHRLASGVAMLAMTAAAISYSRGLGVAMIGLLVAAAVLVPTGFSAWGLWERVFLAVAMASVMVMSKASIDATMRAPAASVSNKGS